MYHVFVDFEMTCWRKYDRVIGEKIQEIIEIGAVKLDENFTLIDTFSVYVKPEFSQLLSKTCTKLTGIRNDVIKDAPSLAEAVVMLEDWLGTEDIKFYSWGKDDKIQLERECTSKGLYNKMPTKYLKWRDFQRIFMKVFGFTRRLGLKAAMEMTGFDFEGQQHRAVDDAMNGARLLMLIKNKDRYKKQRELISEVYNCQKPFTSTVGELIADKLSAFSYAS